MSVYALLNFMCKKIVYSTIGLKVILCDESYHDIIWYGIIVYDMISYSIVEYDIT